MAFSQGFAKGTDVPIEHLDYDYIGKCEKASEVESILKILRYAVVIAREGVTEPLGVFQV